MAGLTSNILLLAIQYLALDCTERTIKLRYKPYGPEMCRQLCEDLEGSFYYVPEDLSCHRFPTLNSAGTSLKHCLTEHISRNHEPALRLNTGPSACNNHNEDVYQVNLKHMTTEAICDLYLGNVRHTISLHKACEEGNLCKVQFILSHRPADINARDKLGRTPVMAAVMKNQVAVFDFLVSQKCDLMAVDNNNDTVLHVACGVGNVDIVKKLVVNHRCDIDRRGMKGMTSVMRSVLYGHRDVFDLLVSKRCNVTTLDDDLNNILHVACSGGHVDMVKHVLSTLNFGIESRGERGRTSVMIAAHRGHIVVFDLLKSIGSNLLAVDEDKDNILHVACIGGHVDMVKYILDKKLQYIESKGKYGRTPVMRAAEYNQRSVVRFLERARCNMIAMDDHADSLLHVACERGHVDMVKYILLNVSSQRKISIDCKGHERWTPLMITAYYGHMSVFTFLVNRGSRLYLVDKNNNGVLHIACKGGHVDIVKYIVENHKSGVNKRGKYRETPVMIAAKFGHQSVVKYLLSKGCKLAMVNAFGESALHSACVSGNIKIVKWIFPKMLHVNNRGGYRRTPLMTAAVLGHLSVVKYLMNKGCGWSLVDGQDNTLLHLACKSGNIKLIKYITSNTKLSIQTKGQHERTPVMTAASFGYVAVVKYLVRTGCKLSGRDDNGWTVLEVACRHSRKDVVKYLMTLKSWSKTCDKF